ncbi:MAG: hypothetical protein ABW047_11395, partial [Nitrospiraceae bacterium]
MLAKTLRNYCSLQSNVNSKYARQGRNIGPVYQKLFSHVLVSLGQCGNVQERGQRIRDHRGSMFHELAASLVPRFSKIIMSLHVATSATPVNE